MNDESHQSGMNIGFSLDHVAVSVSDLDISVTFYTKILGFTCERIIDLPHGNGRIALLRNSGLTIEMFQFNDAVPIPDAGMSLADDLKTAGVRHIALRVKNIQDTVDYLEKQGVEFINRPVTGSRGFQRFFVRDPDGIPLELTEGPDEP